MANRYRDSCSCRIYSELVPLRCYCIVVATATLAAMATARIALVVAAAVGQARANIVVATAPPADIEATVCTAVVVMGAV